MRMGLFLSTAKGKGRRPSRARKAYPALHPPPPPPPPPEELSNVASMVPSAVTFFIVWVATAPTEAPFTFTSLILWFTSGEFVKVWSVP